MKITFRFPRQYGHDDQTYEVASVPTKETVINATNKLIYSVERVEWAMDVDKHLCFPVVVLKCIGEQPDCGA